MFFWPSQPPRHLHLLGSRAKGISTWPTMCLRNLPPLSDASLPARSPPFRGEYPHTPAWGTPHLCLMILDPISQLFQVKGTSAATSVDTTAPRTPSYCPMPRTMYSTSKSIQSSGSHNAEAAVPTNPEAPPTNDRTQAVITRLRPEYTSDSSRRSHPKIPGK